MKFTHFLVLSVLSAVSVASMIAADATRMSYQDYLKAHPNPVANDRAPVPTAVAQPATPLPIPPFDFSKPVPVVTLKNGKSYKDVTFLAFASETVTLSWRGGAAAVAYALLPEHIRPSAEAKRPRVILAGAIPTNSQTSMKPRGPFYLEGNIIEKTNGVAVIVCSGPPFSKGNKDGKIPLANGTVAVKNLPHYSELGVRDMVGATVMRVGDYTSGIGQLPLYIPVAK